MFLHCKSWCKTCNGNAKTIAKFQHSWSSGGINFCFTFNPPISVVNFFLTILIVFVIAMIFILTPGTNIIPTSDVCDLVSTSDINWLLTPLIFKMMPWNRSTIIKFGRLLRLVVFCCCFVSKMLLIIGTNFCVTKTVLQWVLWCKIFFVKANCSDFKIVPGQNKTW